MIRRSDWSKIALLGVLLLTVLVYFPSLQGGFLFDDFPNLGEMNKYGDMHQWENARQFVMNGIAGPTGRPISLLTFVPQADAWFNHNAKPFKIINLIIHLLCGVLLYWVTVLLLKSYGYTKEKIVWIALLSASFWLLHPLFVSTTAYVIQRMAQLPLLFSLLAIVGYFKGRGILNSKPMLAYALMTLSIGLGTILATLSKENGALLPLLIVVIEFCNPSQNNKPLWQWRAFCLWLPSLAIAVMLIRYIDLSPNPWPTRPFNQMERLWTEGRVMIDYLKLLFIPRIEGYGLFQDGYQISRGWLFPPSTLFSILFLLTLLVSAFVCRKKYPLLALAILFFVAAHLMESTVIGLELYFEHRNYVAAIFLFLPVAAGLSTLSEKVKPSIGILASILVLGILATLTWQRAMLWSNTSKLQIYWAQNSPDSARAQAKFADLLMNADQYQQANQVLIRAIQYHPNGALMIQLIQQKIKMNEEKSSDFQQLRQQLLVQRIEPDDVMGLRSLVETVASNSRLAALHADELVALLNELIQNNTSYQRYGMGPLTQLLQGQLYLAKGDVNQAYSHYEAYAIQFQRINLAQIAISDLDHRGYPQLALQLLNKTEREYQQQLIGSPDNQAIMRKLRADIQADMQAGRLAGMDKEKGRQ
ncbi:MAG: hypothetical protein KGO49_10095 [Gammaproteobacteria bacterium]|nr:hypothetical protein [Gammaproteobacteria bacterium]